MGELFVFVLVGRRPLRMLSHSCRALRLIHLPLVFRVSVVASHSSDVFAPLSVIGLAILSRMSVGGFAFLALHCGSDVFAPCLSSDGIYPITRCEWILRCACAPLQKGGTRQQSSVVSNH